MPPRKRRGAMRRLRARGSMALLSPATGGPNPVLGARALRLRVAPADGTEGGSVARFRDDLRTGVGPAVFQQVMMHAVARQFQPEHGRPDSGAKIISKPGHA